MRAMHVCQQPVHNCRTFRVTVMSCVFVNSMFTAAGNHVTLLVHIAEETVVVEFFVYLQRRFLPDSQESATLDDQGSDNDDGDSDDDNEHMSDIGLDDDDASIASPDDNASIASQEGMSSSIMRMTLLITVM